MAAFYTGTPGVQAERTATPRQILLSEESALYFPSAKVVDGSKSRDTGHTGDLDVLRAGLLMGKITTGGKYCPACIGVMGVLHDTSAVTVTMTLPAAVVTELVRRIGTSGTFQITGPAAANSTITTAVNSETVTYSAVPSSTTLTITATTNDYAIGSLIGFADGSYLPTGILGKVDGLKVTDQDGASQDTPLPQLLIGGILKTASVPNWPSEVALARWVKDQLSYAGGSFSYDDVI